jgi:uncharacterized protein DUF6152
MTHLVDRRAFICRAIALLGASRVLRAHHSAAEYATAITTVKNATITRFVWVNPHSLVIFDVKGPDGKVASWTVETGTPTSLSRVGWNRNSLRPGETVTVVLNAARDGSKLGRLVKLVKADGQELLDTQKRESTAAFVK